MCAWYIIPSGVIHHFKLNVFLVFLPQYDQKYKNDIITIVVVPSVLWYYLSHRRTPGSWYFIRNIEAAISSIILFMLPQTLLFMTTYTYNYHHTRQPPHTPPPSTRLIYIGYCQQQIWLFRYSPPKPNTVDSALHQYHLRQGKMVVRNYQPRPVFFHIPPGFITCKYIFLIQ